MLNKIQKKRVCLILAQPGGRTVPAGCNSVRTFSQLSNLVLPAIHFLIWSDFFISSSLSFEFSISLVGQVLWKVLVCWISSNFVEKSCFITIQIMLPKDELVWEKWCLTYFGNRASSYCVRPSNECHMSTMDSSSSVDFGKLWDDASFHTKYHSSGTLTKLRLSRMK